jgi:transposase
MIQLTFAATERAALEVARYTHPHPKVQRRIEALYLKSLELPHGLIRRICQISEPTLLRYLRTYQEHGMEGLQQLNYRGRPDGLQAHASSLEEHFREHPPRSCAHARQMIEDLTGVRRGLTQVRAFLRGLKMKYRKTGFVPGRADTPEKRAEQEEFLKKKSCPPSPKRKPDSGWCFS